VENGLGLADMALLSTLFSTGCKEVLKHQDTTEYTMNELPILLGRLGYELA
jgi:hypothetical protein